MEEPSDRRWKRRLEETNVAPTSCRTCGCGSRGPATVTRRRWRVGASLAGSPLARSSCLDNFTPRSSLATGYAALSAITVSDGLTRPGLHRLSACGSSSKMPAK
jgi:hypothetical protein